MLNKTDESALEKAMGMESGTILCIILLGITINLAIAAKFIFADHLIIIAFAGMTIPPILLGGGIKLFQNIVVKPVATLKLYFFTLPPSLMMATVMSSTV